LCFELHKGPATDAFALSGRKRYEGNLRGPARDAAGDNQAEPEDKIRRAARERAAITLVFRRRSAQRL
jgi:hypothetical protein